MALIYTIDQDGKVVCNGITYPFELPTHRVVGNERVDLSEEEVSCIVEEWIIEYDRVQAELLAIITA